MILLFSAQSPFSHFETCAKQLRGMGGYVKKTRVPIGIPANWATETEDYEIKKLFLKWEGVSLCPLNTKTSIWVLFATRWSERLIVDFAVGKMVK